MSALRASFFDLPRLLWAAPTRAREFWRRLLARPSQLATAEAAPPDALPEASAFETSGQQSGQASATVGTASGLVIGVASSGEKMPRPAIRWLGPRSGIALRSFDYGHDIEAVAAFQRDNYELNFPEFSYSHDFESAFRLDVRRASLDPNHAIYVLDEAGSQGRGCSGVIGFLWLVVCENGWTSERYGYINNVYLLPEKRGLGLASELMAQSDAFFRSRRIRRVRLTVTASNAPAAALYERSGFSTTRWEMEKDIV